MRDSPALRSPTGFGEAFRDLHSLLFISALQVELERLSTASPERPEVSILGDLTESILGQPAQDPTQVRSAGAIASAVFVSEQIRVDRVSYNSPLEIVLSFVEDPGWLGTALLTVAGAGSGVLLVANRAIKLWERISDARIKHSHANLAVVEVRKAEADARAADDDADMKVYEARLKEAEARVKEADAKLRESEVDLKLAAHEALRSDSDVIRTIYQARSKARLETPDPAVSLLQHLDRAAQAIAEIDEMKIIED